jgi:membrane protein required for colicin V production
LPFSGQSEVVKLGISFAVIFFTVLIIGAIVNHLISTAIASIGLGGVDHILGGIFGVLRGGLIVTLLVLLLSLTTVSKNAWWQDSILMPWFEKAAVEVKAMIPQDFSGYFEHTPQDAAK